MAKAAQTTIQCVQCRQPVKAVIHTLIDGGQDPQAKSLLLSGRLNAAVCPQCGTPNKLAVPIMYHDASKELLVSFVPMELGLGKDAQEKAIGELMRDVTSNLPQGSFKAYLLQPRQALTMQGLIDQVLQADGVTPQMMEAQRARVRLLETLMQAPPETLPEVIRQHDAEIDGAFFQTATAILQQIVADGQQSAAQHVAYVQNAAVEHSSFGQELLAAREQQEAVVQEVAEAINTLGAGAKREDFLQMAIGYAEDGERLQALVGLVRPIFDDQFFDDMTAYIGQSAAEEQPRLEQLREDLADLAAMVDEQAQATFADAAAVLQELFQNPNLDEAIAQNLDLMDNTFMQVLTANIQEASRRGDLASSSRLKDIYNRVLKAMQAQMPPELRFINELLGVEDDETTQKIVRARAKEFGAGLIRAIDAVGQQIPAQGAEAIQGRLMLIRSTALEVLQNWMG